MRSGEEVANVHESFSNDRNPGVIRVKRALTKEQAIFATLFVLSFSLDFKGAVGGSLAQYGMATLNALSFLCLGISFRMKMPKRGVSGFILCGWITFVMFGILGAIVSGTPFGHFIRLVEVFVLFLEGLLVALWLGKSQEGAQSLTSLMSVAAIISFVFTFIWGFHFTGENANQIRYQILSPLIPLLISIASFDLLLARRRKMQAFVLLAATLGVIALSVTRGMLLVVGFTAFIVVLAAFWNSVKTSRFPRPIIFAVLLGLAALFFGALVAMGFYPDVIARWIHRSLGAGHDVTFWARVAAVVGQYKALSRGPIEWLTGMGFGTTYPWPLASFPWILPYMMDTVGRTAWFPGEFMWMSLLFEGGAIGGGMAILALLAGAIRGFRLLVVLFKEKTWDNPLLRPLWIGIIGYFSFLGMGFTANPFILRLSAMFMGLCLGLLLAQGKFFLETFKSVQLDP